MKNFALIFLLSLLSLNSFAETKSVLFNLKVGELSESAQLVFELIDNSIVSDAIVIRENGERLQIAASIPDEGNTFPGETICNGAIGKDHLKTEKVSFVNLTSSIKNKTKIVKLDLYGKSLIGILEDVSIDDWSMVLDGKVLCSK